MPPQRSHTPWFMAPMVVSTALAVAGAVFVIATVNEIRSARATLNELTEGHAEQIRRIVSEGQGHALTAFAAWEDQLGRRLLAITTLIDELAVRRLPDQALLDSLARRNDLSCLSIQDATGKNVMAASPPAGGTATATCWRDLLGAGGPPLRAGESRVLRLPTVETGGYRLVAARRRRNGGLVCAGLDATTLAAERRRIGPGRLLQTLGETMDNAFIALQDTLGIVAATPNVERLSTIRSDPLLKQVLMEGTPASRETDFGGRPVLEQITRLRVGDHTVGLLRVGIDLARLQHLERAMSQSIALHSLLLLAALMAGMALLIANRRLVAAQAAWARARREVAALEEERTRQERSAALGELASGVAHEIRNPLNAIHVIAQRLAREFTPAAEVADYNRLTSAVREEVSRINRIVEQFLRYARPSAPYLRMLDLAELVREVTTVVQGRFEARGIELGTETPERLTCRMDSDLIRQALHNLLDNALDACAAGARVMVVLRNDGTSTRLSVSDTGSGIPPEQLGRIFNLYHTTKPNGTGVGLAVVDQVAALHGGRVRVLSEVGSGSTFTMELPCGGPEGEDAR